jgi:RHS repeat-associated protein
MVALKRTPRSSGCSIWGLRYYSPDTGRWASRDPIGEVGGLNVYEAMGNSLIGMVDPDGRSTEQDCRSLISHVEATEFVRELRRRGRERCRGAGGIGVGACLPVKDPCVTKIYCKCCDSGDGAYRPITGTIMVCWGPNVKISTMEKTLWHELGHADSLCRRVPMTCADCMKEEKKNYWRNGECRKDRTCTDQAWESCANFCTLERLLGKTADDYRAPFGWPPEGSLLPSVPRPRWPGSTVIVTR